MSAKVGTSKESPQSLRPFFTLWAGQAISLLGSQIVQFALIWWLTQETGSATVLAVASLVGLLPQVVLGPFVGVLVDRWSRRWTMFAADTAVALASLLLASLFWSGQAAVWHVFGLLFVRALGGAFHWPAMQASTPLMVPQAHLTRIQGLNQMLQGGMSIVAAPLGAILVSLLAMPVLLGIDVATALFAILPLLFVRVPQPPVEAAVDDAGRPQRSSYLADLKSGIRYVVSWPAMLMLIGMAMLLNFLLTPSGALQPLLVTEHFGGTAVHLGVLQAAFGLGIVGGGILLSVWGGFQQRIRTALMGLCGLGIGVLLLGLAPASAFWLALLGAFLVGAMNSLTNGPVMAIFQSAIEPAMQGRVFTLLTSAAMAMSPLSLVVAGPFADLVGVRAWFLLGGGITLLVAISGFFNRTLLAVEQPHQDSEMAGVSAIPETAVDFHSLEKQIAFQKEVGD